MVREDAHVTYKDIEASLRIGSGSAAKILHTNLGVSRVSSCWVPQSLTDGQVTPVEWWREMLQRLNNENSRHISEIIIGDETWIYQYAPETKHQSSVWVFPDDDHLSKWKEQKVLGRKWCSLSLLQVVMWQQYHLSIKEQWLHSGTPQLPSPRFSKNCEKSAQELDWGASCCTMTMSLRTPPIWQWIFWGRLLCSCWPILLTVQTWHPVTSFCFLRWRPDCMGSGFQHLKTWLPHTKKSSVHWMTVTGSSASSRGSGGCDIA